jgi:hypothetical protein
VPRLLAAGLALLAVLAGGAEGAGARPAVETGGIGGALLDADRHPIPGALVTLYERGTGYLVDSTYTRPDGRFDLRPPGRKTDLDLVALQGTDSARASLPAYDPAAPGIYREVRLGHHKSLADEVWDFLLPKLEWIIGTVAGFFLGYLLKQWEGKQEARQTLNRRATELLSLVKAARRQLADSTRGLSEVVPDARYLKALADLGPRIAALEAELPKSEDAVFSLRGAEGSREYADYHDRIQQLREIVDSQKDVGFGGAKDRLKELGDLLAGLETHSLTGSQSLGWRRGRRWREWRRTASNS